MSFLFSAAACLFCLSLNCMGQPPGVQMVTIEGKKYYVHRIIKGETLYGISRRYGVEVEKIAMENPQIVNTLRAGDKIRIPVMEKPAVTAAPDSGHISRTVEPGETLFSLSKEYGMSIEELKNLNPDLTSGLKAGMTLRIPLRRKTEEEARTPPADTGESEPEAKAPEDTVSSAAVVLSDTASPLFRDVYRIALFLPFYLEENDVQETDKATDGEGKIAPRAEIALQFYEGALMALDSMKNQGLQARLYVYDVSSDSATIADFLAQSQTELTTMDLLIGPLYRTALMPVAHFAQSHGINIISPLVTTPQILRGMPLMGKITPSAEQCVRKLSSYICEHHAGKRLIVLHRGEESEKQLADLFQHEIREVRPADIRMIHYRDTIAKVWSSLSPSDTNLLIIPSSDQVFVSRIIRLLNEKHQNYPMLVFGLPVWKDFSNLETEYLQNLSVHIPSYTFLDYESEAVRQFEKNFFLRYHTTPDEFACQGFDVLYCCLNLLNKYGSRFNPWLPQFHYEGLQANYRFRSLSPSDGYENTDLFILTYRDYRLTRVQ